MRRINPQSLLSLPPLSSFFPSLSTEYTLAGTHIQSRYSSVIRYQLLITPAQADTSTTSSTQQKRPTSHRQTNQPPLAARPLIQSTPEPRSNGADRDLVGVSDRGGIQQGSSGTYSIDGWTRSYVRVLWWPGSMYIL